MHIERKANRGKCSSTEVNSRYELKVSFKLGKIISFNDTEIREWFDKTSVRMYKQSRRSGHSETKSIRLYRSVLREGMVSYLCFFLLVYTLISTGASTVVTLVAAPRGSVSTSARPVECHCFLEIFYLREK